MFGLRRAAMGVRALATTASGISTVGFVGLGNMGGHMARNLLKKGITLQVFDTQSAILDSFAKAGARVAASPEAAAANVDAVITMLPAAAHVRQVYAEVLKTARPGTLLIDCSTIDPGTATEVSSNARDAKMRMIDAPVSGGVRGAEAGTLTFMVGGAEPDVKDAEPLLLRMGATTFHCGANGTGQVAKICNNMLLAIGMLGTAEAMNLGVKHGMDPNLLAKIINVSSGRCWSSEVYNPAPGVIPTAPSSNNYNGGFGTALMAKDLVLAAQAASDIKAHTPLGGLANDVYQQLLKDGFGGKDFSVVYEWIRKHN